jgi:hypothetical protein
VLAVLVGLLTVPVPSSGLDPLFFPAAPVGEEDARDGEAVTVAPVARSAARPPAPPDTRVRPDHPRHPSSPPGGVVGATPPVLDCRFQPLRC